MIAIQTLVFLALSPYSIAFTTQYRSLTKKYGLRAVNYSSLRFTRPLFSPLTSTLS